MGMVSEWIGVWGLCGGEGGGEGGVWPARLVPDGQKLCDVRMERVWNVNVQLLQQQQSS